MFYQVSRGVPPIQNRLCGLDLSTLFPIPPNFCTHTTTKRFVQLVDAFMHSTTFLRRIVRRNVSKNISLLFVESIYHICCSSVRDTFLRAIDHWHLRVFYLLVPIDCRWV
ncbi:hypothetical protein CW304_21160 [Bacillus sp. UFRGS-B20]|nr:hypothetical protein CW304_21160 [Bacillus sp. UFRGS-B20]